MQEYAVAPYLSTLRGFPASRSPSSSTKTTRTRSPPEADPPPAEILPPYVRATALSISSPSFLNNHSVSNLRAVARNAHRVEHLGPARGSACGREARRRQVRSDLEPLGKLGASARERHVLLSPDDREWRPDEEDGAPQIIICGSDKNGCREAPT